MICAAATVVDQPAAEAVRAAAMCPLCRLGICLGGLPFVRAAALGRRSRPCVAAVGVFAYVQTDAVGSSRLSVITL
jgi:hypothetical protein